MIETVVCDWSVVLSDDTLPVYGANMQLLEYYGRERIGFEEWKRKTGLTPAGFLRNMGISADEQETYERYKGYFNAIVANGVMPHIYAGVLEALVGLQAKNLRLAVLSSHPEQNLRAEINRYGIEGFFQVVIGNVIDKTLGLIDFCNRFGSIPNQTPYFGDTVYDIRAAKSAGLISGAAFSGYHSRERLDAEDPDIIIKDFSWLTWVL